MFNWDDLKFFLEVSKTLNLTKASGVLNVDQTTVYRRILRFEKRIGRKLLKKNPRGYSLTSWGEGLVTKFSGIDGEMKKVQMFLDDELSDIFGTVNITTTNVIANVVLPPLLIKFNKNYPNLKLEITVREDFFDMYKREADLAIRSSDTVEPHVYAEKIGKGGWALYATKDYLKGKPGINSTKFYTNNNFISGSEKIAHTKSTVWMKSKIKDENIVLRASSMETIYSAVKAGFGIGLLPHVYKKMDNSLVELSEPDPKFGSIIWLITQKELINNEKIKISLSFFYKELRKVFHY